MVEQLAQVTGSSAWSRYDFISLYHAYQGYINDPVGIKMDALQVGTKSKQAVQRMLKNIHERGEASLKRLFPKDPTVWSALDDNELRHAVQVP